MIADLSGRVAIVTGAGGYLGRAICRALDTAGAHVVLVGRQEEALRETRRVLTGGTIAACDITRDVSWLALADQVRASYGELSILVNAAYSGRTGTVFSVDRQDFIDAYDVTVAAAFGLTKTLHPLLRIAASRRKGSAIVNVASMYGTVSPDPAVYGGSRMNSPPSYGAAKAALIQFTRYAAVHLGPEGIRVNAVSPGPFPPAKVQAAQPDFTARLAAKVPLGRIGRAEEVGHAVLFLASDAASYITGANLPVDGGWTAW